MSSTATAATRANGTATLGDEDGGPARASRRRALVLAVALVAVLVAAAAWFFLLRGADGASAPAAPEPGQVVALEPISVNLADGKYLRVAIALQATKDVAKAPDGSRALDLTISTFSGQDAATLADATGRETLRQVLLEKVSKAYDEQVMDVYFTEFVTQ